MKKIFPALFGNEKLKETLGKDIALGRHSHAYILEGADGTGKMTAALSAAAALACEKRSDPMSPLPCGECTACRKVFGGISPDVCVIDSGERKTIGVESIRELKSDLYVLPNDGDFRVYIINDAHIMTPQAQNALLISLEEPPPFVVFFLLANDSRSLLETIRSRSPVIRMEHFTPGRIREFISRRSDAGHILKDEERLDEICVLSAPALGRALELITVDSGAKAAKDQAGERRKHALALCEAMISGERVRVLDTVRSFPKGRESLREILLLCGDALRDVAVLKFSPSSDTVFFANAEEAAALARRTTVARINELFAAVDKYADLLSKNASEAIVSTLLCME